MSFGLVIRRGREKILGVGKERHGFLRVKIVFI